MKKNVNGIAVIGLTARFPQAENADEFLENLRAGRESITHRTDADLRALGYSEESLRDSNFMASGGELEGADMFDAAFFGFSPAEAALLDPQQRIALECAYATMENAGYIPGFGEHRIGVYCGSGLSTYWMRPDLYNELTGPYPVSALFANANDFLATRIAYKLNMNGPAINIQTACSTALVSVHLACQALLGGDADLALAGASDLYLYDAPGYFYEEGGILSKDGHCRTFDARATGTVPGRGVGFVLLRPLADALESRDHIHAVIMGSAINNDGARKVGYTAPSVEGQADAIHESHAIANFAPESIGYIEAHGTGTPLGDPIEIRALNEVLGSAALASCGIGSVKTNIGHLGAAAGMAGIIKTILAVREGELYPNSNFESPNPDLELEQGPFFVVSEHRPWPGKPGPRRAGVSSFGIGGTNAHIALEEAPAEKIVRVAELSIPAPILLPLSAKNEIGLAKVRDRFAEFLSCTDDVTLPDAAFSLAVGRKAYAHRAIALVESRAEALRILETRSASEYFSDTTGDRTGRPVALLLPGQNVQYRNMTRGVYESEESFRGELDACAETLLEIGQPDIRRIIFAQDAGAANGSSVGDLNRTEFTQPALFAVVYSCARWLAERGIRPAAYLGHSLGEYVAACLAGVFSRDDALRIVARRGELMGRTEPGGMLAVLLEEERILELGLTDIDVAAVNAKGRTVLSGSLKAVENAEQKLKERGVECLRLPATRAFHSRLMEPVRAEYQAFLERIPFAPPRVPFVSNLTGTLIRPEDAVSSAYWWNHMRRPVRFAVGLDTLLEDKAVVCLETGPGTTLTRLARHHAGAQGRVFSLGLADQSAGDQAERHAFYTGLGRLWCAGAALNWERFYSSQQRRRVPLPTYPFERVRHGFPPLPPPDKKGNRVTTPTAQIAERESILFRASTWKRDPFPHKLIEFAGSPLFFLNEGGFGTNLVDRFDSTRRPIFVCDGDAFVRIGENEFQINAARSTDYDRLFAELKAAGALPELICDFRATRRSSVADDEELYFLGPLYLARALARAQDGLSSKQQRTTREILFFSTEVERVFGNEPIVPGKSLLKGVLNVIPIEYPGLRCRHIDLEVVTPENAAMLNDCAFGELGRPIDPGENQAAYRSGVRWRPLREDFDPDQMDGARLGDLLQPEAAYLITGASGGVGGRITERFRAMGVGRLGLLSRGGGQSYPGTLTLRANIADENELREALMLFRSELGPIRGVIHAAGLAGGGLIDELTAETVAATLAPKVRGTLNLIETTREDPLDFLLLCSSMAAISGNVGQADYSAANAFLDAAAVWRAPSPAALSKSKPFVVSINWDRWRNTGMAASGFAARTANQVYSRTINAGRDWFLDEHRYNGRALMPGTAYLEFARAAFARTHNQFPIRFAEAVFLEPLIAEDQEDKLTHTVFETEDRTSSAHDDSTTRGFSVLSRDSTGNLHEHVSGRIGTARAAVSETVAPAEIAEIRERCGRRRFTGRDFQNSMESSPLDLRGRWHADLSIELGTREALATVSLAGVYAHETDEMALHPALLDLCIGFARVESEDTSLYLPLSYKNFIIYSGLPPTVVAHARLILRPEEQEILSYEIRVMNEAGRVVARVQEFTVKRVRNSDIFHVQTRHALDPVRASHFEALLGHRGSTDDSLGGLDPEIALDALWQLPLDHLPTIQVVANDSSYRLRYARETQTASTPDGAALSSTTAAHARPELQTEYVPPQSATEQQLAGLWESTLGIERIGIHDNFFQLGGDSLLALRMIPRVRAAGFNMEPATLFQNPTIAGLATLFEGRQESVVREAAPGEETAAGASASTTDGDKDKDNGNRLETVDRDQIARALKGVKYKRR